MTDKQYDDAILDSNALDPTDVDGNPIPVTIPIMLAPGVKVVYTTRLGGTSEGDYAHCNLGGKSGDDPNHVLANRVALSNAIDAKLSLVSQVLLSVPALLTSTSRRPHLAMISLYSS